MRIGVKLYNYGPDADQLLEAAQIADQAGFASVWLSDRLINPAEQTSPYPFSSDNSVPWPADVKFYESTVSLASVAAVTKNVEVAVGVLVLPLRHPVIVAKQFASLDALSGGRIVLGVGVGWMADEFKAVGENFRDRGRRTDDAIAVIRSLWTGRSDQFDGDHYQLAANTYCYPTPAHPIPIIVGGMTPAALRRAGAVGDGWLGILPADTLDVEEVEGLVGHVRQAAADAGRDPTAARCVLTVSGEPRKVAPLSADLERAGVDELVLHAKLDDVDDARASFEAVADVLQSA